jgi:hypothetical protein
MGHSFITSLIAPCAFSPSASNTVHRANTFSGFDYAYSMILGFIQNRVTDEIQQMAGSFPFPKRRGKY